jgi:cell division septum initiation protein DivIVA
MSERIQAEHERLKREVEGLQREHGAARMAALACSVWYSRSSMAQTSRSAEDQKTEARVGMSGRIVTGNKNGTVRPYYNSL